MDIKKYGNYKVEVLKVQGYKGIKYVVEGNATFSNGLGIHADEELHGEFLNCLTAGVALYGDFFLTNDKLGKELRDNVFGLARAPFDAVDMKSVNLGIEKVKITEYNLDTKKEKETETTKAISKSIVEGYKTAELCLDDDQEIEA